MSMAGINLNKRVLGNNDKKLLNQQHYFIAETIRDQK